MGNLLVGVKDVSCHCGESDVGRRREGNGAQGEAVGPVVPCVGVIDIVIFLFCFVFYFKKNSDLQALCWILTWQKGG